MRTGSLIFLLLLAGICGCGRIGYDLGPDPAATGGGGFAGAASEPTGGGGSGGMLSSLDGGQPRTIPLELEPLDGCLVVTTDSDEADTDEVATPPHAGSGLSLREAIALANSNAGHDCVQFERAMTIGASSLPSIVDSVTIDGEQRVILNGTSGTGLELAVDGNTVSGLEVSGFTRSIVAKTSNNRFYDLNLHGGQIGLQVEGSGTLIVRSFIHDNDAQNIQIKDGTIDTTIVLTILSGSGGYGIQGKSNQQLTLRHVTFYDNAVAIDIRAGSGDILIENTLFVSNSVAIQVDDTIALAIISFCGFFDNGADCSTCALEDTSLFIDPAFVDAAAGDFHLSADSPVVDKGTDTGLDVNGNDPGLFNGAAPDIGALESD